MPSSPSGHHVIEASCATGSPKPLPVWPSVQRDANSVGLRVGLISAGIDYEQPIINLHSKDHGSSAGAQNACPTANPTGCSHRSSSSAGMASSRANDTVFLIGYQQILVG